MRKHHVVVVPWEVRMDEGALVAVMTVVDAHRRSMSSYEQTLALVNS